MSNPMKAADDLKSLASKFRSILEIAEVLEKLGNLEQAERDLNNRLEGIQKDIQAAQSDFDAQVKKLTEAQGKVSAAESKASGLVDGANAKAIEIVNDAKKEAASIVDAANAKKSEIENKVSSLRIDLESIKKTIAEKQSELAGINDQIEQAKKKISSFVN